MTDPASAVPDPAPAVQVRPARDGDARAIAEIHVRTWQAAYVGIVPADYLAGLQVERYEAMWRGCIETGTPQLLVAERAGSVLGWVAFGASRDAGAAVDEAEIWAIYVAAAHWAGGVGHALWAATLARLRAQGWARVGLWAFPQNLRAARFYRAIGFEVEPASTKQFELGAARLDEIHFVRALAPAD